VTKDEGVRLASILHDSLNLSPYESRAYLELILHGEVTPGRLSGFSGIPRPRAYDVLRSLVRRGLATERRGRPVRYKAVDPRHGITNLLDQVKNEMKRSVARTRASARVLTGELGKLYERAEEQEGNEERVVVSGSSGAFWELFRMLKERTKHEYLGASASALIPPYEIFLKEERMLQKGIKLRLIRPFPLMRRLYVGWYLRLISKGFEIRSSTQVDFSFDVSDCKEVLIWLNDRTDCPATEVLWLHRTPLARLLAAHFEKLWVNAEPVKNRLERMLT
jgi:sugar-specific transcriptional regulator TrmB